MKIFASFCAILLLILNGCICAMENEMSESSNDVYATMTSAQKKIGTNLSISPSGIGSAGSKLNGGFTSLGIDFKSHNRCFTRNEGRRMLINAIQIFICEINSARKIQSALNPSPFEINNLSVTIYNQIASPDKLGAIPYLDAICIDEGIIEYLYIIRRGEGYHSIVRETYDEALAILEKEKTDCAPTD